MIVFAGAKGKVKRLNDKYTGKCYIASSANAWMNEELTKSWVQNVLGRLLLLDSACWLGMRVVVI